MNQTCHYCQHDNAAGDRYCGQCGAALEPGAVVVGRQSRLLNSRPELPAVQLRRIGISLAVTVAALAAEAGMIYLRRRVQRMRAAESLEAPERSKSMALRPLPETAQLKSQKLTVINERVIEERRFGRPIRRIIERVAWQREENADEGI